ncbi:CopG family transcriptional regulator [Candidatus Synechococcus calcipolaris G9]|uniref:CopG family transcriptional regulator n=1 Tax=Candidatus Synechococcus calcipolaris G9 TaxID=1497997 RepID=A0ABT6F2K2_9SYNE|nr:CopG family transcriptional regulator [Candidatus Synechococcus calcipolaris]MDG2992095.1 CopG family transcriptional regulator [Candidatus Synechococcus calcipolaris G9]
MKAEELDLKFERGEPVLEYFDLSTVKRPQLEIKRVNVDFPMWMIQALDREAQRLGIHRQAVIKTWIAQRLDGQTTASKNY